MITLIQAPLSGLAARSTPKGSGALGYGLIMAVWSNVAVALVALVPLMPRAIMNRREGEH